jgi:hypothetical protein
MMEVLDAHAGSSRSRGGESTSMRRGSAVELFILDPVALGELALIMTSKVELS